MASTSRVPDRIIGSQVSRAGHEIDVKLINEHGDELHVWMSSSGAMNVTLAPFGGESQSIAQRARATEVPTVTPTGA